MVRLVLYMQTVWLSIHRTKGAAGLTVQLLLTTSSNPQRQAPQKRAFIANPQSKLKSRELFQLQKLTTTCARAATS